MSVMVLAGPWSGGLPPAHGATEQGIIMRFLWNHERISYGRSVEVTNFDGSPRVATPVRYDGKLIGHVTRAEYAPDGWCYRLDGDLGKLWTSGYQTRADAADHLMSSASPSATWLS